MAAGPSDFAAALSAHMRSMRPRSRTSAAANRSGGGASCHDGVPQGGDASCHVETAPCRPKVRGASSRLAPAKRKALDGPATLTRRRSFSAREQACLAQRAESFCKGFVAEFGTRQGWLTAFIAQYAEDGEPAPLREQIRRACRTEMARRLRAGAAPEGRTLKLSTRRRPGGGRPRVARALEDELWHWFVDRISSVQARINSHVLLCQAETFKMDMLEMHQTLVESGMADPAFPPKVPRLDYRFVYRWRKRYGVSWRAVNLRYKVSASKRDSRLRIAWCNALRLRVLHSALHGPNQLRFVGWDQKPMWFNSAHDSKTLAIRGQSRVAVKENTAASRERFTILTNCLSWTPRTTAREELLMPARRDVQAGRTRVARAERAGEEGVARAALGDDAGEPEVARAASSVGGASGARAVPADGPDSLSAMAPPIAVLFRSQSETGARIRRNLKVPPSTLLQFAPKGSYRLANMLQFIDWALGKADDAKDTFVVVLDWYAVHLDPEVDEALESRGHTVLRLGGGITGDIQVGDTHRHGPYMKGYREREVADNLRQLSIRPGKLPETSRQTVTMRALAAWEDFLSLQGGQEWIQNAFLNALDGSEDSHIRSDLRPVWDRLEMPRWRARIIAEVNAKVSSGEITSWAQCSTLLEAYDDHAPLREGMEAAAADVVSQDDGDSDVKTDDDAPSDVAAEAREADELPAATPCEPQTQPSSAAHTPGFFPADIEVRARADLAKDTVGDALAALADCGALLRGLDDGAADFLEKRLANRLRQQADLTQETKVWLRARTLQRKNDEAVARAAAAAEDRERDRLAQEVRLAKAQEATARAVAGASKTEAKVHLERLRLEQKESKACKEQERERRELLRRHLVDWLLGRAKAFWRDPVEGKGRGIALRRRLDELKALKLTKAPPTPTPWSPKDTAGCLDISPSDFHLMAPTRKQKEFASESLALRLYKGRRPGEAATSKTVVRRAEDMLDECLPEFRERFPMYMQIHNSFPTHKGDLDLAMFEVLWRYSHGVGEKVFPVGLFCWPLPAVDMEAFLRSVERADLIPRAKAVARAAAAPVAGSVCGDAAIPSSSVAPAPTKKVPAAAATATAKAVAKTSALQVAASSAKVKKATAAVGSVAVAKAAAAKKGSKTTTTKEKPAPVAPVVPAPRPKADGMFSRWDDLG